MTQNEWVVTSNTTATRAERSWNTTSVAAQSEKTRTNSRKGIWPARPAQPIMAAQAISRVPGCQTEPRIKKGRRRVLGQVSNREFRSGSRSAALLSKISARVSWYPAMHHSPLDQINLLSDATGFNIDGLYRTECRCVRDRFSFPSIRPVNNIP